MALLSLRYRKKGLHRESGPQTSLIVDWSLAGRVGNDANVGD